MNDISLPMWSYWRDKHGIKIALEDYYKNNLDSDPILKQAYIQLVSAEILIDSIMKEKE